MNFHERRLCLAGTLAILLGLTLVSTGVGQKKSGNPGTSEGEDPKLATPKVDPVKSSSQPKPKTGVGGIPSTKTSKKKKPVNPKRIRVFLMDNSVIVGELSVNSIEVQTEFGKLTIPVTKIISITPGLDSHTKLNATIKKMIAGLGDDDYKTREQSHKDLLAMGIPVRDVVAEFTEDKNAERKRHAVEIVKKLDEIAEQDIDDFDSDSNKPKKYVRYDVVETQNFTIAGRISPSSFQVASKYGPLKVSLKDIKKTEREFVGKEDINRKLNVPGNTLVLRTMKSSGIRVSAGDTISVSATGRVIMTPWGSSSSTGPEGNTRYSYYSVGSTRYNGGALLARVGDSGNYQLVGTRKKWVAKKSGVLKFGVAMNPSYASSSYYFPGNYSLRIKVKPKQ